MRKISAPVMCLTIVVLLLAGGAASARPSAARQPAHVVIAVWPKLKVPMAQRAGRFNRWPTLTEYLAPADKANGTAVILCPGGGYSHEATKKEGYAVADWFNTLGVSAFVLNYRLPRHALPPGGVPWALQDVRRAMQIIRLQAAAWHINVHKVGVAGFSAGGSLASLAGVHSLPGNPSARNPLDRINTRPNFLILGYPVISMMPGVTNPGSHNSLLGRDAGRIVDEYFSSELNVTVLTPPAFIFYAHDDPVVNHQNEKLFAAALRRCGVPVAVVEFRHGGHGFGMGLRGTDSVQWPAQCVKWMRKMGYLPKSGR